MFIIYERLYNTLWIAYVKQIMNVFAKDLLVFPAKSSNGGEKLKYWLNENCYYPMSLINSTLTPIPALAVAVTKKQAKAKTFKAIRRSGGSLVLSS
jgi:hypothetical protein